MWLYLKLGFYSVVHKPPCNKDELLIRTRSRIDIDKLHKKVQEQYQFAGEIMASPNADYAFRMVVPRKVFAAFVAENVIHLDYSNFKNTVRGKDYQRHDAYMKCWEAMYEWQRDIKRGESR